MFKPSQFDGVADEILAIYQQMEEEILEQMSKDLTSQAMKYQEMKFDEMEKHKKMILRIIDQYNKDGAKVLKRMSIRAYLIGMMGADSDLADMGFGGGGSGIDLSTSTSYTDDVKLMGSFGSLHVSAINALASEYAGAIQGMLVQVARRENDIFQKVIKEVMGSAITGMTTRVQATQKALDKFASNGIGGFVDKAGRVWDIGSYAQMATRTGLVHASVQGHITRLQERGKDLVIVSSHSRACDLCRPWQRKILSLSGKDERYPSLSQAISAGLYHPNCGHSLSAYIEGLTEVEDEDDGSAHLYQDQQNLRNAERHIRQWKKKLATAVTPEAKLKAENKIAQWQQMARNISKSTGIPRKYSNEKIHPAHFQKIPDKMKPAPTTPTKKPITPTKKPTVKKPVKKEDPYTLKYSSKLTNTVKGYKNSEKRLEKVGGVVIAYGRQGSTYMYTKGGYATKDKVSIDTKYKFDPKETDITKLATLFSGHITGVNYNPTHHFNYDQDEWNRRIGKNVAGYNQGGRVIHYGPSRSKILEDAIKSKKWGDLFLEDEDIYEAFTTLVHEQVHSWKKDSRHQFEQYMQGGKTEKYWRATEEGITEFLAQNLTPTFMTMLGFDKKIAQQMAYKDAVNPTSYPLEVAIVKTFASVVAYNNKWDRAEVTTSLINFKENNNMTTRNWSKWIAENSGVDQQKAESAVNKLFVFFVNNENTDYRYSDVADVLEDLGMDLGLLDKFASVNDRFNYKKLHQLFEDVIKENESNK